jgi:hypothetical protein
MRIDPLILTFSHDGEKGLVDGMSVSFRDGKIPIGPSFGKLKTGTLGKGEGNESLLNLPLGRGESKSAFS